MRAVVIALVVAAALLTCAGVIRVSRQHEVLRLGFELSRRTEQLGRLHEARRQLELELATLAAPDRIRRLATQLGMAPVSPDRIRVLDPAAATAPAPDAHPTAPTSDAHPTAPTSGAHPTAPTSDAHPAAPAPDAHPAAPAPDARARVTQPNAHAPEAP
ncbi:MAG TPA: cell division protein FtsL [Kofleriaceae bacterium]